MEDSVYIVELMLGISTHQDGGQREGSISAA